MYKVIITAFVFYDEDTALNWEDSALDALCDLKESAEVAFTAIVEEFDDE